MSRLRSVRRVARAGELADEQAVRAAYLAHGPELYRFAHRQLGDGTTAQDVVQETFIRAWRSSATYDPQIATLRTWLFSITRNVIIDLARRDAVRPWQRPAGDATDHAVGSAGSIARFDDSLVDAWVVEEALGRLSTEHRDAIVQTHLRHRSHDDVAAEFGIPVGTLRSRVFYGLKALRLAMEEMGVEP